MQDASADFDAAMTVGTVVWVRPQVWADWANDGYGSSGGIDDLSRQQGNGPIVVSQFLDEGLPDDVAFTSSGETSTLAAPMAGGRGALNASQYFSRPRTDSPIVGYDRDVAPMKIDIGAVTAAGREYVRIFTGQMADTPVVGRAATVEALSSTRLKLAKSVFLPPLYAGIEGLTGSWPVSFAMAECGVYVSPPPRPGCRYWAPMHGSLRPFVPSYEPLTHSGPDDSGLALRYYWNGTTLTQIYNAPEPEMADGEPYWTDGPYLEAPNVRANTDVVLFTFSNAMPMADGDPLFELDGAVGRIEFMVRGDAVNVNTTPGGSAFWSSVFPDGWFNSIVLTDNVLSPSRKLALAIRRSDRKPVLTITDSGGSYSLVGATALPSDGNWYGIGGAWDYDLNKLWLYYNGTVTSSGYALDTANLAVTAPKLVLTAIVPWAELHITGGAQANPDGYPWVFDTGYGFSPGAVIGRSRLAPLVLVEAAPSPAWDLLGTYAQAELASVRTNEQDLVEYLPLSWWVFNDHVDDPVDTLSTDTVGDKPGSVASLDLSYDLTKIRNSGTVKYTDVTVSEQLAQSAVFSLSSTQIALPPGPTVLDVVFDTPAVYINNRTHVSLLNEAGIANCKANANSIQASLATINTAADGSGSYITNTALVAFTVLEDWTAHSATVVFNNLTGNTYYLANDQSFPPIVITGVAARLADATVTVQDVNSIAIRGERNVPITATVVQSKENATWLATAVVGLHAYPRPRIKNVEVFADPRRQPGDLVRIVDVENTGLDDQFRLVGVKHTVDQGGAKYTQTVTARQQDPVGVWDQSTWDNCVWGE